MNMMSGCTPMTKVIHPQQQQVLLYILFLCTVHVKKKTKKVANNIDHRAQQ